MIDQFGEPHSRQLLPTPALVCDADLLSGNIERMATIAASANVGLRPHVKSHSPPTSLDDSWTRSGRPGVRQALRAEAVVARLRAEGYAAPISALLTSPLVGARSTSERWHSLENVT